MSERTPVTRKKSFITLSAVSFVEKIFFIQNLGLMIRSGFSIGDALAVLGQETKSDLFKKIIAQLHADVVKGDSFANALAAHPNTFDDLFVNMVSAGEASGNLEETLRQLSIHMKKTYSLKRKIRNALFYPVLILVFMLIMGIFVFIYVIPNILNLYSGESYTIPLPTRIILVVSGFISTHALILITITIVISFILYLLWRSTPGRYAYSQFALHLPIFGTIVKKISVAGITRVLHSLIITDIPIVKSYEMISRTIGNRVYKRHLQQSSELLSKGNSIYSTLSGRPDLFDPVIAQMIKVGEDTGALDEMTSEIANFYEEEVDSTMQNLTNLIEPILMIFIGVGVGFLAVAIILPIYGLANQI